MKTPMQELIEQLNELEAKLTSLEDAMYRGGVRNAKRLAEELLKKEKEILETSTGTRVNGKDYHQCETSESPQRIRIIS